MHLLIRAVSLAGQPLTQAHSAYFDERGGTIGRSDTNTLALPDPERRISRLQAEVSRGPEGWRLLNVGNANPIWHNNRPVPPGEAVLLDENDELQIGTYALQVVYSPNDPTARTITKGRAAVDARTVIVGSGQEPRTDPSLMHPLERGSMASPSAPAMPSPTPVVPVSPASPASPFADLLGDLGAVGNAPASPAFGSPAVSSSSPFADLFGAPASSPSPSSSPSSAAAPAVARLPDDFDPFADLQAAAPAPVRGAAPQGGWDLPAGAKPPASASPFDLNPGASPLPGDLDLLGAVAPAGAHSIDQLFGLGGGAGSAAVDPLAAFLKQTEPAAPHEAPAGAPSNVDPLSLLKPRAEVVVELRASEAPPATLPDDVPELNAAMPLPPVEPARATLLDDLDLSPQTVPSVHVASPSVDEAPTVNDAVAAVPALVPASASTEAAPDAASANTSADTQALWAAFCEGAGIQFKPPQGLNPDLMRVIGQLLHHAVDGSLKLVAARAATKQEMRAEVTVIQARRNNPLKFSPDTQSAMEQLLQPPLRGFMTGPEAVADAMDDLLGHTIGTMVGMRAALEGVLARFEPQALEAKLVGRSMLDSLLPMNRRAKLWELYLQHYGAVKAEAQDDFHNLFGRAFLQAYEEQLDRLDTERRSKA